MPAAILRLGERQGRKIVVDDVYDEATDPDAELEDGDEPQFFVTVVPYVDRDDVDAISEELDRVARQAPSFTAGKDSATA